MTVITRSNCFCTWNYSNYKRKIFQARLTGHDFLDIGTGNFENTNYPRLYVFGQTSANATKQANEVEIQMVVEYFTQVQTQDGNYRVGELFRGIAGTRWCYFKC